MKFKHLLSNLASITPFTPLVIACALVCTSSNIFAQQATGVSPQQKAPIKVAVASNFTHTLKALVEVFEDSTENEVIISHGSSGKLYAQIKNGAPYQVFFSADQDKPLALEQSGLTVDDSRFTYAIGRLGLWSPLSGSKLNAAILKENTFRKLAIANPKLAPYGVAALDVLRNLNLLDATQNKHIQGENVAQTYQFVSTGNADLGFVALAQVMRDGKVTKGSVWVIPETLYQPIRQDAVLLNRGKDSAGARALLKFMRSDQAQSILEAYGYRMPLN